MANQNLTIEFAPKPKYSFFKDLEGNRYGRLLVIGFAGMLPLGQICSHKPLNRFARR